MDSIIVDANNERAVELLTDAAIQGHHQAQLDLGYYNGRSDVGLPQDYLRAKYWYEKSAANGDAIAFNNLGVLYRDGKGVTQNNAKALENFSTAIEYGYEEAYCKLGNMFLYIPELQDVEKAEQLLVEGARIQKTDCYYDLGYLYDEVLQQYKLAAYYYLQAIEYDHAAAESNLGLLFQDGTGVEQSDETAFKLFQSAADKGNPPAMVNLARAYENGTGTPVDYAKAIEWYKTAINKGSDQAIHNLGSMYNKGLGIEKNRQKAISLLQKAAENNNRFSLFNLANAYRTGYGLPQDFFKSVEHYIKSFKAGYSPALNEVHSLAISLLEDGDRQQESLQWLEEAMELGNPRAALELAQIYHFGKFGIAADHQKAFCRYEKAIENGSAVAAANLGFW